MIKSIKNKLGKLELEEVIVAIIVIIMIILGILFLTAFKEKSLAALEKLKEIFGR